MKKLLLIFLLTATAYAQQSISCTLTTPKNLTPTAFNCSPSPNNQFSASFTATVNPIVVVVTPNPSSLILNGTQQFAAMVTNAAVTSAVTWSTNGGTISSTGLYTGTIVGAFTVTATSVQDPTVSGSAPVSVSFAPPSAGGDNTYCQPGNVATFGSTDGPSTLPQACTNTAEASTPSPGAVTSVSTNLQGALNAAACGDTLSLTVGNTFTGVFTIPNKGCDSAHWIKIQSAANSGLPAEGVRETPCYSGVSSLPNRPALNCASTTVVTAKIVANGDSAFVLADGAAYYRIGPGLEITHASGLPAGQPSSIVAITGISTLPSNIIVDRVWVHGVPGVFSKNGVKLDGANVALIDSTVSDIHAVGSDSRGVAVGTGPGPFKITDVFAEGGGSSILFGNQAAPFGNPTNIEVRRNHLYIPLTQMAQNAIWDGLLWTVGPRLEVRNAVNMLLEGNILQYAWGDQNTSHAQGGDGSIAWLGSKNTGNCSTCNVNNVTIRYNAIGHAGGGFFLEDQVSSTGLLAAIASNFSEHDNQFDDISLAWARKGASFGTVHRSFGSILFPPPSNISIVHNTGISLSGSGFLSLGNNNPTSPYFGFVFQNNIEYQLTYGMYGCAGLFGVSMLNNCTISPLFTNNLVVGNRRVSLPPGNFNVPVTSQVGFTSFNNGNGGNYTLLPSSPYISAGTDGRPLGADINAITQATAGVN